MLKVFDTFFGLHSGIHGANVSIVLSIFSSLPAGASEISCKPIRISPRVPHRHHPAMLAPSDGERASPTPRNAIGALVPTCQSSSCRIAPETCSKLVEMLDWILDDVVTDGTLRHREGECFRFIQRAWFTSLIAIPCQPISGRDLDHPCDRLRCVVAGPEAMTRRDASNFIAGKLPCAVIHLVPLEPISETPRGSIFRVQRVNVFNDLRG